MRLTAIRKTALRADSGEKGLRALLPGPLIPARGHSPLDTDLIGNFKMGHERILHGVQRAVPSGGDEGFGEKGA